MLALMRQAWRHSIFKGDILPKRAGPVSNRTPLLMVSLDPLWPITSHLCVRKTIVRGANSSCKVQPRLNHSLRWNAAISSLLPTSTRYARHTSACRYHLNIELMACVTSCASCLFMQHVSIHSHFTPGTCLLTYSAKPFTFSYPIFSVLRFSLTSMYVASTSAPSAHRCDAITYSGGFE